MTNTVEYALMAGSAYRTTRTEINLFPVPQGWTPFFPVPDQTAPLFPGSTGFEAISFQNGTDVVISYSGTDPNKANPLTSADGRTNAALAAGNWSEQLLLAAEYFLQVKTANPSATNITLTGHSLGGGLAALVGVFFGVTATTFDQAPFAKSATALSGNATALRDLLLANGHTAEDIAPLTTFLQLRSVGNSSFIPRSESIDTIRVAGEFLDGGFAGFSAIGNPATTIVPGPANWFLSSFDLHSQSLLTAFLQSAQAAANEGTPSMALSDVSQFPRSSGAPPGRRAGLPGERRDGSQIHC
jgi:hypothetical protein